MLINVFRVISIQKGEFGLTGRWVWSGLELNSAGKWISWARFEDHWALGSGIRLQFCLVHTLQESHTSPLSVQFHHPTVDGNVRSQNFTDAQHKLQKHKTYFYWISVEPRCIIQISDRKQKERVCVREREKSDTRKKEALCSFFSVCCCSSVRFSGWLVLLWAPQRQNITGERWISSALVTTWMESELFPQRPCHTSL